jgi:co-chaperonin GroES (HSP10)
MFDLGNKRFTAIGKKVLILRDEQTKKSGGIWIPEEYQEFGWFGTVLQVGQKVENVAKDDRIMFLKDYTFLPFKERRLAITDCNKIAATLTDKGEYEGINVLNDNLLIAPECGSKVVNGVALPWDRDTGAHGGLVVGAGSECVDVGVGARVFYNHNIALKCSENGDLRHIITEEQILCQIPKT